MALTDNLVSHYLLNSNSDDYHGSYDGTDTDVTYNDNAAEFNGTSSYIDSGYKFNTSNSGTISAWAKIPNNPTSFAYVVGSYDSDLNKIYLQINDTGYIAYGVGSTSGTTTTTITLDNYEHIVLTFSGGNAEMYLNGVSIKTFTYSGLGESLVSHYFGARNANGSAAAFLESKISNIRFYSDAKDQSFINDLYSEGYIPDPVATATITVTATADATLLYADIEMFTFVQSVQQSNYSQFRFVQSIGQPSTANIIERVNV